MRVTIRGEVHIKGDGKEIVIKNNLSLANIIRFIVRALTNSVQNVEQAQRIVYNVIYGIPVNVKICEASHTIIWCGSTTVNAYTLITTLCLWASFNGCFFNASTAVTEVLLSPGTYTFEWVWDVNDPVGLIYCLFALALNYKLKCTSISIVYPSATFVEVIANGCIISFFGYVIVSMGSSLSFDYVCTCVKVTCTGGTTKTFKIKTDTAYNVKVTLPSSVPIVQSIIIG
jgi:hypothetical protein